MLFGMNNNMNMNNNFNPMINNPMNQTGNIQ